MKNFMNNPLIENSGAAAAEALQAPFGAEKINFAVFFRFQGLFPGNVGLTDGVLDQNVGFFLFPSPGLGGSRDRGPQTQGLAHLFYRQVSNDSHQKA
jgi:hypothetical protein